MSIARQPRVRDFRRSHYDVAIVGAGMGGLSAAALLSRAGARVLVLEAMHSPGGCASSYEKSGGIFDVGATTLSGTGLGQPLAELFARIGPFDELLPTDPPMGIHLDGEWITRFRDRDAWLHEAERTFEQPMREFWNAIATYSDAAYALLARLPFLPPRNIRETAAIIPYLSLDWLRRAPRLLAPVSRWMRRCRVDSDRFRRFVDAQLLITSQARAADVPFLAGALGLSYPDYPLHSVRGGMIRYARFLADRATESGADVAYLQRVTAIEQRGTGWRLRTVTHRDVEARTVITDIPIFNLPDVTDGAVRTHFQGVVGQIRHRGVRLWGAFTIYALVERSLGAGLPVNLQVILDSPLRYTGSTTLFLTFSHPDDDTRAPEGLRTLSISTHLDPGHAARPVTRGEYQGWKNAAEQEIFIALRTQIPEFQDMHVHHSQAGTPRTFRKYTGRADGLVGGLPLDRRLFPFHYPRPGTPFDGLYCLGDTVFPGQGLPGVTLAALALTKRLGVGQ